MGSKSFTESVILGEIVAQAARAAGVPVEHRAGLGGTRLVWNALETGEIDVYPEYTGTIVEEILSGERPAAGQPSGTWLRERLAARGLVLSAPLGFDNSYALGHARGARRAARACARSPISGGTRRCASVSAASS